MGMLRTHIFTLNNILYIKNCAPTPPLKMLAERVGARPNTPYVLGKRYKMGFFRKKIIIYCILFYKA